MLQVVWVSRRAATMRVCMSCVAVNAYLSYPLLDSRQNLILTPAKEGACTGAHCAVHALACYVVNNAGLCH